MRATSCVYTVERQANLRAAKRGSTVCEAWERFGHTQLVAMAIAKSKERRQSITPAQHRTKDALRVSSAHL